MPKTFVASSGTSDVRPEAPSDRDMLNAGLRTIEQIKRGFLDLLFPPRCVGCQETGVWLCDACRQEIEPITPPFCRHCGRPTRRRELCHICKDNPITLDGIRAVAYFDGPLRQAIHRLKYNNLPVLAEPLSRLLSQYLAQRPIPCDLIIPVPLHPSRRRERGYNQAGLLARELGERRGLPVVAGELRRARETASQVGLDAEERRENVQNAFRWQGDPLTGQAVLLIDDVVTTGATLEACGAPLRAAGAGSVWGLALARGR